MYEIIKKIPQHENGDIYAAEECFCIKFSLFIHHTFFHILLHLLNVGEAKQHQSQCLIFAN